MGEEGEEHIKGDADGDPGGTKAKHLVVSSFSQHLDVAAPLYLNPSHLCPGVFISLLLELSSVIIPAFVQGSSGQP